MYECLPACMIVHSFMTIACRAQKMVSDPLEPELLASMSGYVVLETQVKFSASVLMLSHLSSPYLLHFVYTFI